MLLQRPRQPPDPRRLCNPKTASLGSMRPRAMLADHRGTGPRARVTTSMTTLTRRAIFASAAWIALACESNHAPERAAPDAGGAGASMGGAGTSAGGAGGAQGGSAQGGSAQGGSAQGGSAQGGGQPDDAGPPDAETDAMAPTTPEECASPQDSWVFCSDFESGNKDEWDDYDGNPDTTNLLMDDPGPFALPSNQVMRLRVPPGRGGADLVKLLPDAYDRLYARWYVKYEPGFDFDARNHGAGLHAGARNYLGHSDTRPQGNDWYSAWLEYNTSHHRLQLYSYSVGMYQDCVDPNGQCWGDVFPCTADEGQAFCEKPQHRETVDGPTLQTDRWYCVEVMMDGGTPQSQALDANGQLDFWVDGQEIGPWTDLWLRTDPDLKPDLLWLSLFHHEEHSEAGLMLDHVVVSRQRIGCL